MKYIQVAVPVPIRKVFTYAVPAEIDDTAPCLIGKRVYVPFGKRRLVAVCINEEEVEALASAKAIDAVLDDFAAINQQQLAIAFWLADFYQHAIGEVITTMLPVTLRKKAYLSELCDDYLQRCEQTHTDKLPTKQAVLYASLAEGAKPLNQIKQDFSPAVIKGLLDKNLIEKSQQVMPPQPGQTLISLAQQFHANVEQSIAISAINDSHSFAVFLLEGVTGSGKTEVYLQAIETRLLQGQQILILVPEIGLTPQTLARFEQRFGPVVVSLHSGLSDLQRYKIWHQARRGDKGIFIGTRSSIFLPFDNLGMIIVDEEHDESYKQQDGLRYHARDLAVYRAKQANIPLIMGSATPSLESLQNALSKKYHHLRLHKRAGNASMPVQHLFNIAGAELHCGIASGLLDKMKVHLAQGDQVLLFVNRRGYAPALQCHQCGHVESCVACDAPFTVHKVGNNLQCHRCCQVAAIPKHCRQCHSGDLNTQGIGTEQLEQFLVDYFPDYPSVRIDSDSTRSKTAFNQMLEDINHKRYRILIGTQILSKGHHFPDVTLAIILNIDSLLFSGDFRAPERIGQLVTQLSGRAGRANRAGEVWLQTHQPGHPLLQDLINNGFTDFSRSLLSERKAAGLPPFSYQALIRAESELANKAIEFLHYASSMLSQFSRASLLGPMPCLIEKKQNRFRFQIVIQSENRQYLTSLLKQVLFELEQHKLSHSVRWHVDMQALDFS